MDRFCEFDYEGLIEKEGRRRKPRLPKDKEELFKDKLTQFQDNSNGGSIRAIEIQKLLTKFSFLVVTILRFDTILFTSPEHLFPPWMSFSITVIVVVKNYI